MRLTELSAKYESSGSPGAIAKNPQDIGGWSYGIYQFASGPGVVQEFVEWLRGLEGPARDIGEDLANAGDPRWSERFVETWKQYAETRGEAFTALQEEYAINIYYGTGAQRLADSGFDISGRSAVLKAVLFSNSIQHGTYWGAEVFKEAAKLSGQDLNKMSDSDIIWWVYQVKLTDLSWSSGCPDVDRPGLLPKWAEWRWNAEREDALWALKMT